MRPLTRWYMVSINTFFFFFKCNEESAAVEVESPGEGFSHALKWMRKDDGRVKNLFALPPLQVDWIRDTVSLT